MSTGVSNFESPDDITVNFVYIRYDITDTPADVAARIDKKIGDRKGFAILLVRSNSVDSQPSMLQTYLATLLLPVRDLKNNNLQALFDNCNYTRFYGDTFESDYDHAKAHSLQISFPGIPELQFVGVHLADNPFHLSDLSELKIQPPSAGRESLPYILNEKYICFNRNQAADGSDISTGLWSIFDRKYNNQEIRNISLQWNLVQAYPDIDASAVPPPQALNDLTDVNTTPADGEVLTYVAGSSEWQAVAATGLPAGLQDGDILRYNTATSSWTRDPATNIFIQGSEIQSSINGNIQLNAAGNGFFACQPQGSNLYLSSGAHTRVEAFDETPAYVELRARGAEGYVYLNGTKPSLVATEPIAPDRVIKYTGATPLEVKDNVSSHVDSNVIPNRQYVDDQTGLIETKAVDTTTDFAVDKAYNDINSCAIVHYSGLYRGVPLSLPKEALGTPAGSGYSNIQADFNPVTFYSYLNIADQGPGLPPFYGGGLLPTPGSNVSYTTIGSRASVFAETSITNPPAEDGSCRIDLNPGIGNANGFPNWTICIMCQDIQAPPPNPNLYGDGRLIVLTPNESTVEWNTSNACIALTHDDNSTSLNAQYQQGFNITGSPVQNYSPPIAKSDLRAFTSGKPAFMVFSCDGSQVRFRLYNGVDNGTLGQPIPCIDSSTNPLPLVSGLDIKELAICWSNNGAKEQTMKFSDVLAFDNDLPDPEIDNLAHRMLYEFNVPMDTAPVPGVPGTGLTFERDTPPAPNNDAGEGHCIGSRWFDTTNDEEYVCLDNTNSNAVWKKTTVEPAPPPIPPAENLFHAKRRQGNPNNFDEYSVDNLVAPSQFEINYFETGDPSNPDINNQVRYLQESPTGIAKVGGFLETAGRTIPNGDQTNTIYPITSITDLGGYVRYDIGAPVSGQVNIFPVMKFKIRQPDPAVTAVNDSIGINAVAGGYDLNAYSKNWGASRLKYLNIAHVPATNPGDGNCMILGAAYGTITEIVLSYRDLASPTYNTAWIVRNIRPGFTLSAHHVVGATCGGGYFKIDSYTNIVNQYVVLGVTPITFTSGAILGGLSQWNFELYPSRNTISDLLDATVSAPTIGDRLQWSGSQWTNSQTPVGMLGFYDPVTPWSLVGGVGTVAPATALDTDSVLFTPGLAGELVLGGTTNWLCMASWSVGHDSTSNNQNVTYELRINGAPELLSRQYSRTQNTGEPLSVSGIGALKLNVGDTVSIHCSNNTGAADVRIYSYALSILAIKQRA